MNAEMLAAKRDKKERMFYAPNIIKCYNYWEEEQTNSMVFITQLIEGTKGVGRGAMFVGSCGRGRGRPQLCYL